MTKIHIFRTGSVWIKTAQVRAKGEGLKRTLNCLFDSEWSQELAIHAYLIEHEEGLILVDAGEIAAATRPGYFPRWHPYFWFGLKSRVSPEEEIGPQLRAAGFDPADVRTVVLTHMHSDHMGGIDYFPQARVVVSDIEWKAAQGFAGQAAGYANHRWPQWLKPERISPPKPGENLLDASLPLTRDGAVRAIAAPGHTPGHMAVGVEADGLLYLLAGDSSYLLSTLRENAPDGLGADPKAEVATQKRILAYAARHPLVYLNGHDPECAERLARKETLVPV